VHPQQAAPGGPRFDPDLTATERMAPTNGIWLCQNCAHLIDSDPKRYTTDILRNWRKSAERYADNQLGQKWAFNGLKGPNLVECPAEYWRDEGVCSNTPPIIEGWKDHLLAITTSEFPSADEIAIIAEGQGASCQSYSVVAVGHNYGWDWEVLFYTLGELGWEVTARIQLTGQKGCCPEATYVLGKPGSLALTHVVTYGTGAFMRSTTWYRLARGNLKPFLSVPCYFYINGWGMPFTREVYCKILDYPKFLRMGEVLSFSYRASYQMLEEESCEIESCNLLSLEGILSLEWNEEIGIFVPVTELDDVTIIEDLWNDGTAEFVNRNREYIEFLAASGTERQKKFVRQYLLPNSL
jgi:hypothetical protein